MTDAVLKFVPGDRRVHTPFGHGVVWYLFRAGSEADMMWGVMHDDGRFIEVPNYEMRGQINWSIGRRTPETPRRAVNGELTGQPKQE